MLSICFYNLYRTKERLAEPNTDLLLQERQSRLSLSTFNPKPGLETPYERNFYNFSLNGNSTQRGKLAISISKAQTSTDFMKVSYVIFFPLGFRFLI